MYQIIGVSQFGREIIDHADTVREACYLVGEYRLAFGPGWTITYKRAARGVDRCM